jgi:EcsC protein family
MRPAFTGSRKKTGTGYPRRIISRLPGTPQGLKRLPIVMLEEDLNALRSAVAALEHPGLAARLGEIAGKPIELLGRALPEVASKAVATATTKALNAALAVAFRTMQNDPKAASGLLHKALVTTSGAVGGSFGLAALPIELPISTIIMLRSIGDIARSEGEDLTTPETALSCLQVFALGGLKGERDAAESGYFAVRACSLNRLQRLHVSSSTAACSPKARQSWYGLSRWSHPTSA